eukprot:2677389-Pyramimonas_sp.AAC.1
MPLLVYERCLLRATGAALITLLLSTLFCLPYTAARRTVVCTADEPWKHAFSTDLYDLPDGNEVSASLTEHTAPPEPPHRSPYHPQSCANTAQHHILWLLHPRLF